MALDQQDILSIASRDFILGNTTISEQIEFIDDQINDPFNSGSTNFYKRLRNMVQNKDKLDEICIDLLNRIEDQYPNLEFDLSEYSQHLDGVFNAIYKFFVRNPQKHIEIFLREYIYAGKNRKNLTADYMNQKLPNYPKEQYGKKEFYILIVKLPAIIKDIFDEDIKLSKYIEYLERADNSPMYIRIISNLLEKGIIADHGVTADLYKKFKNSDNYDNAICKLQMKITENLINPYLEENGLLELRNPPVEPDEEDTDDDENEESSAED